MDLRFSESQLLKWAQFSGDFNPIHFDIARAQQAGSEGIIVHGMLALLQIKQAVDKVQNPPAQGAWRSVKARLKLPLQQNAQYHLSWTDSARMKKFALRDVDGRDDLIQGSFTATPPLDAGPAIQTDVLAPNRLEDCLELFSKSFSGISSLWIALDAIVFSDFICSEIPYESARQQHMDHGAANQRDLMVQALTVQTFHTVSVGDALIGRHIGARRDIHSLDYRLTKVSGVRTRPDTVLGSHELDIYINHHFAMRSEIGTLVTSLHKQQDSGKP